jgi:hypothetical protein
MNDDAPSSTHRAVSDRAISCALVIGVLCMTLLILGVILISVGWP